LFSAVASAARSPVSWAARRAQVWMACSARSAIGNKDEQARAHNGLGQAHHAIGDPGQACHHCQEALALYAELGAPEADQVRDQLTVVHNDGHAEREASRQQ
jgi:hypothetical protein